MAVCFENYTKPINTLETGFRVSGYWSRWYMSCIYHSVPKACSNIWMQATSLTFYLLWLNFFVRFAQGIAHRTHGVWDNLYIFFGSCFGSFNTPGRRGGSEDKASMFLRNVGTRLLDYTVITQRRQYGSSPPWKQSLIYLDFLTDLNLLGFRVNKDSQWKV
jgi:hypothetical protein